MHKIVNPYTPQDIGSLLNLLGSMMLSAPGFEDKTGYFSNRSIATEFASLSRGLEAVRKKIGEENYNKLLQVSSRMRAHFEAGQRGQPEEVSAGRKCIEEMEDIIRFASRTKR